jgi:hypothetical protein
MTSLGGRAVGRKRKGRISADLPDLNVDPRAIRAEKELRDRVFQMRLTESEQKELRETADRLGVTITTYLLGLHKQAMRTLRRKGK